MVEEVKWYSSIEELLMVEGTRYTLSSTDNYEEGIKSINSLTGYSEGIKENGVYAIHIKLIDDPYIVAVTMCNKESVASKICSVILSKHLAASCQIYKTNSFYWWNDELEKGTEYRLEFRTKKSLYNRIEEEIRKVHDYEVAEIMYYTINSTNNDFLEWIDKEAISDK